MPTLRQLKDSIRHDIWADHEAENLVGPHDRLFLEALGRIQKDVVCEQQRNANVILFCNTFTKCGMTVVPRPRGIIRSVYTIANEDWCDPVIYRRGTMKQVECFSPDCRSFVAPANEGMAKLPLAFKRAEASTDAAEGRARSGMWALQDDQVFISPWIQSNERVVIEWAGVKAASDWTEDDPVSDALDFRDAVKLFVQYGHERDYGDMQAALAFHNPQRTGVYDEALAELIWQCRQEMMQKDDESCRRCPTYAQIKDDAP